MRTLTILSILCVSFMAIANLANAQTSLQPKEFPIGFWCGPPEKFMTEEQFRLIKAAGFTVVLPPCEGVVTPEMNRKLLSLCRRLGLQAIITDSRIPLAMTGNDKALDNLKAVANEYSKASSLMGYFITDEPGAKQFGELAKVVKALRKLDPQHAAFINLFPNYASTDRDANPSQLNTATYDEYLDTYLNTVQPDVLSYDHYHFLKGSDRPGFLGNLASAQKAARTAEVPFWNIILSIAHGSYRPLNENELRYEALQSLAYGVKGLLYFTYWLPPDDSTFTWSHAIMERDGKPGALYEPVKRVNEDVRAIAAYLYPAKCLMTYQTGEIPLDGTKQPGSSLARSEGKSNLTIGVFRDAMGYLYALATNRDYKAETTTKMQFYAGKRQIELFDPKTKTFKPIAEKVNGEGMTEHATTLLPAGYALFRWQ